MPTFIIQVCYRTVETRWGEVEVEAHSKDEALAFAEQIVDETGGDLDWGKEEIVDAEYHYYVGDPLEDE